MIEAIVASALLVVVALGVLKGLDTAQHSSGREKARAVAAALTEQDQERLRAFRAIDLADYDETRTVTVNNAPYEIVSKGDWIKDSTGGTSSCNNTGAEADYMRITTTTSSGLINSPIPPITMSSLVAPPAGKFSVTQGTLGVQVNNRDGVGTAGVPVTITGPSTDTKNTNSAGCAIFPSIPIGSYTASVSTFGFVDHSGGSPGTVAGTVTSGTVSVSTLEYDDAASAAVTFDTETRLGLTPGEAHDNRPCSGSPQRRALASDNLRRKSLSQGWGRCTIQVNNSRTFDSLRPQSVIGDRCHDGDTSNSDQQSAS